MIRSKVERKLGELVRALEEDKLLGTGTNSCFALQVTAKGKQFQVKFQAGGTVFDDKVDQPFLSRRFDVNRV